MPLGEIAGSITEAIAKFIGRMFIDIFFEILVKGAGYIIVTTIKGSKYGEVDPDGSVVAITGIIFWLAVGALAYGIYASTSTS